MLLIFKQGTNPQTLTKLLPYTKFTNFKLKAITPSLIGPSKLHGAMLLLLKILDFYR